jgi:hypothetical protein
MWHRLGFLLLVSLAAFLFAPKAEASGDYGCGYNWTLSHPELDRCSNLAFLSPGNDTRTNLLILSGDAHPGSFRYAPAKDENGKLLAGQALFEWSTFRYSLYGGNTVEESGSSPGDGTLCGSNAGGIAAFEKAIGAAKAVPASEKTALITARRASAKTCESEADSAATLAAAAAAVTSSEGKPFLSYLQGAFAFYDGQFGEAEPLFASVAKASSPWLKEAAAYMQGRVALNLAQADAYEDWGTPKSELSAEAKAALAKAEGGFLAYLRDYPKGQYAGSARGLLRRVYWLGGNTEKLLAEYEWQLAQPQYAAGNMNFGDLANEIDSKLALNIDLKSVKNPQLLAMLVLQRLRTRDADYSETKQITASDLDVLKDRFAKKPELYGYLQAAHAFFVGKNSKAVLQLISDAAKQKDMSPLQFSRQMLRGMALDANNDVNARGFWLDMFSGAKQPYQRETLELALALHEERNNGLARVFDKASQIKDRVIRQNLLQYSAGPALLRQQANDRAASQNERDVALFVLLYKQVTRGAYADFIKDSQLVKANANTDGYFYDLTSGGPVPLGLFANGKKGNSYVCPSLQESAATLAKTPKNASALLCVAEFARINGFDGAGFEEQPAKDELGGAKSQFPGEPFSRLELYKGIIADPATRSEDKAYALYRAVYCFAPGGNNSCRGKEVPLSQRKAWFNQLKKNHPNTQWAKSLQIFW